MTDSPKKKIQLRGEEKRKMKEYQREAGFKTFTYSAGRADETFL
jgi:hypothetical protein